MKYMEYLYKAHDPAGTEPALLPQVQGRDFGIFVTEQSPPLRCCASTAASSDKYPKP